MNYYIAYRADKKLQCGCLTLIVRNAALAEKFDGGLSAYIQKESAICNQDISISGYMGDDLDESIEDLIESGLEPKKDFTVINVWDYEISIMMSGKDSEKPHTIDLNVDWLEAEHSKDGIDVWYKQD